MKVSPMIRRRVVVADDAFADLAVWHVPQPVPGSAHPFKYRLAYVVDGQCVVRFDNESGKGDHRHLGSSEAPYILSTPDRLMADVYAEIERWNSENGRA